ncbi:MAG: hypothetical protein OXH00_02920 [Candidatus Poribacteria bacterium]|nr:hypothetical protein [Candidatus Poribacteria bacterium]
MRESDSENVNSEESGGRRSVANGDASSNADTIMNRIRLMARNISVNFAVM